MSFINFINKNILPAFVGLTLILGCGIISPASSQRQLNCVDPYSEAEKRGCAYLEYERADRELNLVWGQVISQLNDHEKEQLIDRQLAWIQERDSTCDLETERSRGASGHYLFLYTCLIRVTVVRTEVLRKYLQ